MIRKLRRRHRAAFTVLGVLLPVGFVAALAARPEFPVAEAGPDSSGAGAAVRHVPPPTAPVEGPDVLVYLVAGEFAGETLPDDARLLGSYAPLVRLPLPDGLEPGTQTLIYFSLGHGEIVHAETF